MSVSEFRGVAQYGDPNLYDRRRSSAPICFVLDRDSIGKTFDTYPFDTGGITYAQKNFDLEEKIALEDFLLTSDPEAPEKIVSSIFEDNIAYMRGEVPEKCRKAVHALDFQTQQLLEIFTSPEKNSTDDRISTIEIQLDHEFTLSAASILAIAAPDIICESSEFKDLLATLSADPIPYPWRRASNYQRATQIEDAVRSYIDAKGLA